MQMQSLVLAFNRTNTQKTEMTKETQTKNQMTKINEKMHQTFASTLYRNPLPEKKHAHAKQPIFC